MIAQGKPCLINHACQVPKSVDAELELGGPRVGGPWGEVTVRLKMHETRNAKVLALETWRCRAPMQLEIAT